MKSAVLQQVFRYGRGRGTDLNKFSILILCLGVFSCKQTSEVVDPISISVQNLPALPQGAGHYQLWVRYYIFNKVAGENSPQHEGDFLSVGEFTVAGDGAVRSLSGGTPEFALPAGYDPQLLGDMCIAVQAPEGLAKTNHAEPGSILIGGKVYGDASNAIADLNLSFAGGLKSNFVSVSGKCTIVAPTSPADSNAGVWFVNAGSAPTTGLVNLPVLPTTWKYEGWVVDQSTNTYHSTGKFARPDSADYDGAGPNAGSAGAAYNFPGEDFVTGTFHPNLTQSKFTFLVTIEPFPDNSPAPFFLQVLKTTPPLSVTRTQAFQNTISTSAPSARIAIRR